MARVREVSEDKAGRGVTNVTANEKKNATFSQHCARFRKRNTTVRR